MFLEDASNVFPDRHQSVRSGRKIMLNQTMKPAETIAGYGGIHMMFGVVIHLPIEKSHPGV